MSQALQQGVRQAAVRRGGNGRAAGGAAEPPFNSHWWHRTTSHVWGMAVDRRLLSETERDDGSSLGQVGAAQSASVSCGVVDGCRVSAIGCGHRRSRDQRT